MALFLESADLDEIKRSSEWSFLAGVTCNPSLIGKALNKNRITQSEFFEYIEKIFSLTHGRVFIQTNYWEENAILEETERLGSIFSDRIVFKIPFCEEGIRAVHRMKDRGLTVALSAIFNPLQAFLSAQTGVDFVIPYCNRMGRVGQDGIEMVRQTVALLASQKLQSRVLVASIRTQTQVLQLLDSGAEDLTVPFSLIEEIIAHPLSWEAAELFSHDLQVHAGKEKKTKKTDEIEILASLDF